MSKSSVYWWSLLGCGFMFFCFMVEFKESSRELSLGAGGFILALSAVMYGLINPDEVDETIPVAIQVAYK